MTTEPTFEAPVTAAPPASVTTPLLISLGITLLMTVASGWVWSQVAADARVPMHWDAAGQVNG
ncbi:MAG: hypothetical protein ACHQ5A_12100, partial [Opitutales bacterium]